MPTEVPTAKTSSRSFRLLFALLSGAYLATLPFGPIYDETEGQYAGAVREMMDHGSWLPTNNGLPRLQKPPLVYYTMAASAWTFGNHEAALRLPFVLATLGWLALTCALGATLAPPAHVRAAAVFLAFSLGPAVFARMIMPEPFLALSVTGTLFCLVRAVLQPDRARHWGLLAWLAMAFGCLAKGLHAAAWPLLIAALCRLFLPQWRTALLCLRHLPGFLCFLAPQLLWYVLIEILHPGFLRDNLWNEQLGHAFHYRNPPTYERVPLGIFLGQHLLLLGPAALYAPAAWKCWRSKSAGTVPWASRFLLIWTLVILVTSACSARQDYYTLSAWGAFTLWVFLSGAAQTPTPPRLPPMAFALAGLAILAGGLWMGSLDAAPASGLFRQGASDQFLGILLNLPPEARASLSSLAVFAGLTLLLGGLAALLLIRTNRPHLAWLAVAAACTGPWLGAILGFARMGDYFSLKSTAVWLNGQSARYRIVCDGPPNLASSLFYYTDDTVYSVRANPRADIAVRVLGTGLDRYPTVNELETWWINPQPVALITHASQLDYWKATLPAPVVTVDAARSGQRILLTNQPLNGRSSAPR